MSILSILGPRSRSRGTDSANELDACLDVAIDRMTHDHASADEAAAIIHQIIADHRERP